LENFRRNVVGRAARTRAGAGERRKPKVPDTHTHCGGQKQVAGLDVAVHNAARCQVGQRRHCLVRVVAHLGLREALAAATHLRERAVGAHIHGDELEMLVAGAADPPHNLQYIYIHIHVHACMHACVTRKCAASAQQVHSSAQYLRTYVHVRV
jgi:hypothetical protein